MNEKTIVFRARTRWPNERPEIRLTPTRLEQTSAYGIPRWVSRTTIASILRGGKKSGSVRVSLRTWSSLGYMTRIYHRTYPFRRTKHSFAIGCQKVTGSQFETLKKWAYAPARRAAARARRRSSR